jgi:hypothetical protein
MLGLIELVRGRYWKVEVTAFKVTVMNIFLSVMIKGIGTFEMIVI